MYGSLKLEKVDGKSVYEYADIYMVRDRGSKETRTVEEQKLVIATWTRLPLERIPFESVHLSGTHVFVDSPWTHLD